MGEKRGNVGAQEIAIRRNLLLSKIKAITRTIVENLSNERSFHFRIPKFLSYCTNSQTDPNSIGCLCSLDKSVGEDTIGLGKSWSVTRINVMLRVLSVVQRLLQENRHGSKRDIYYMHPSIFKDQSVVDRAINDICILLQCSRHQLNVVSVGNGLVMGWVRFMEAGKIFDCINGPNKVHSIPVHVEDVNAIESVAKYILVVEKESVFQRLANDKFCASNKCIVITGRGYPDVSTRRFLQLLMVKLVLPVYCLVDCDPYGIDILTTYRFGSMKMSYDAKFLRAPDICWIGVFPSDAEKFSIPKKCLLPMTQEDKRKTELILNRCYLEREAPEWRSELELMLHRGIKFEIEALSVNSISFLSDVYLPQKIQT